MTDQEKSQLQVLLQDAGHSVETIQAAINAIKLAKTGDRSALIALVPKVAEEAKKDFADVKAALPVIKAGYKTTEFWLVAGAGIITVMFQALGKPINFDVTAALSGLIGIYTVIRGLAKKPTA
jgi:hypothetical protein